MWLETPNDRTACLRGTNSRLQLEKSPIRQAVRVRRCLRMEKMTQQRFFAQIFSLLVALVCCTALTLAQQNSLGVAPASLEIKIKRGSTQTQTYTLFNNTAERLHFRTSVIDYWYDENNNRMTGRPGTLPRSASLWVHFSPSEVIIEPQGSATVKATFTVPSDAAGGYYTMPVFEAMPDKSDSQAASATVGNMATASVGVRFRGLVMLTTEEGSEYRVEMLGAKVLAPTASRPFEINIDVHNQGIVHARLRGVFAILDAKGVLTGRGKIETERFLPGQRSMMKVPWAGDLTPGRYTAVVTLTYDRVGMEPATLTYDLPFEVSR